MESKEAACLSKGLHSRLETLEKQFVAPWLPKHSKATKTIADIESHLRMSIPWLLSVKTVVALRFALSSVRVISHERISPHSGRRYSRYLRAGRFWCRGDEVHKMTSCTGLVDLFSAFFYSLLYPQPFFNHFTFFLELHSPCIYPLGCLEMLHEHSPLFPRVLVEYS